MSKQTRRTKALKALFPASDAYQQIAGERMGAVVFTRWLRVAADGTYLQPGEIRTAKGTHYDPGFAPGNAYVVTYPKRNGRGALRKALDALAGAYTLNWEERA